MSPCHQLKQFVLAEITCLLTFQIAFSTNDCYIYSTVQSDGV